MTFWLYGERIAVVTDPSGLPCRFTWCNQVHTVTYIANSWQVDQQWWLKRIWRDYYKLTTDTDWLVLIFHDRLTDHWYLQRLYD